MKTPTLQRQLRLLDAVGIGFDAIIGAGIFVVTVRICSNRTRTG